MAIQCCVENFVTKMQKTLELKSTSMLTVTAVLHSTDMDGLEIALSEAAGPEKDFFENDFTVIDIGHLSKDAAIDWKQLLALFRSCRLNPVLVRNAPQHMQEQILSNGLALDEIALQPRIPPQQVAEDTQPAQPAQQAAQPVSEPVSAQVEVPAASAMFVDTPVRSGQQIYAKNADLIITAVVNPGAEVIADGSIHVYAPLKGRAAAGASGNTQARIFTLSMEAELVSIAGVYSTNEAFAATVEKGSPSQISLDGNKIRIKPVNGAM
ncbi:MAG: minC [Burkholderiaceae bacterium]|nr:minC [Burkholderiaceae bacterium]